MWPTSEIRALSEQYSGSRVIVFGSTGVVGQSMAAALSRGSAELTLPIRDSSRASQIFADQSISGDTCEIDLERSGEAAELIRSVRPHVVFNVAGYGVDLQESDAALHQRLNSELTLEICRAIDSTEGWPGQNLIHVGTEVEFGPVGGNLADPWQCEPSSVYGKSKFSGSVHLLNEADRRHLKAVCARLFTVYGPTGHPGRLLPTLLEAVRAGTPIPLTSGQQMRDFVHIDDAVEAMLRLGLAEAEFLPRALNVATGRLHSVREFVETAADVFGIERNRLRFGEIPTRASEIPHDAVSIDSLKALVGWAPMISIEEGLRRTFARFEF